MKVKIAACDDSKVMLQQISGYLEQLQEEVEYELIPSYYSDGEELLAKLSVGTNLLLLDISMTGIDGISCARILREKGFSAPIIFITSMEEYSLKGYEVHAFGFLVKPVTYSDFSRVIKEALALSAPTEKSLLHINTNDGLKVIDPDKLLYAEVYKHETSFVLEQEKAESTVQLSVIEHKLLSLGFFRCHRGYIVSFKKITFIGKDFLTMENGENIPLSKHRRKEFLDAYSNFMGVNLP